MQELDCFLCRQLCLLLSLQLEHLTFNTFLLSNNASGNLTAVNYAHPLLTLRPRGGVHNRAAAAGCSQQVPVNTYKNSHNATMTSKNVRPAVVPQQLLGKLFRLWCSPNPPPSNEKAPCHLKTCACFACQPSKTTSQEFQDLTSIAASRGHVC
jgi:hypothetical protein